MSKSEELTYEQALEELDQRLRAIETGELSLENTLKAVDEARVYLKLCQERLDAARKRVEVRPEEPAPGAGDESAAGAAEGLFPEDM